MPLAGMNEMLSYNQVATSCRPARISESDDNAVGRRIKPTTDFTDVTNEKDEERVVLLAFVRSVTSVKSVSSVVPPLPFGCGR